MPKRYIDRCAPKPEVYTLDKTNCISGYINIPFDTTIIAAQDYIQESSKNLDGQLYTEDSKETASSNRRDGKYDVLDDSEQQNQRSGDTDDNSSACELKDTNHRGDSVGELSNEKASVVANPSADSEMLPCQKDEVETEQMEVHKELIEFGQNDTIQIVPNAAVTKELKDNHNLKKSLTKTEREAAAPEGGIEDWASDKERSKVQQTAATQLVPQAADAGNSLIDVPQTMKISPNVETTIDAEETAKDLWDDIFVKEFSLDCSPNNSCVIDILKVAETIMARDFASPDSEQNEICTNGNLQHSTEVVETEETAKSNEGVLSIEDKKPSRSDSNQIVKRELGEKGEISITQAEGKSSYGVQFPENDGLRPETPIVLDHIESYQLIKSNAHPNSYIVEDRYSATAFDSAASLPVVLGSDIQTLKKHLSISSETTVMTRPIVGSVDVVIEESHMLDGDCGLRKDNAELLVVSANDFLNDGEDQMFSPPTNIQGTSTLLVESIDSQSNSGIHGDESTKDFKNEELQSSNVQLAECSSKWKGSDSSNQPRKLEIISVVSIEASEERLDANFARRDAVNSIGATGNVEEAPPMSNTHKPASAQEAEHDSRSKSMQSQAGDRFSIPFEISIKKKDTVDGKLQKKLFASDETLSKGDHVTKTQSTCDKPNLLLDTTLIQNEHSSGALERNKDHSVTSLLKKIGIPNNDATVNRMIDLLDEELSDDDGESLSLILALTRSETDTSSINGSISPQSSSLERDILRKDIKDILTSSKTNILQKEAAQSSFRYRIDRARAMALKAKKALDAEQGRAIAPQSSNYSSTVNKSTFPRSPLLSALLQRLNKSLDDDGKDSTIIESMVTTTRHLSLDSIVSSNIKGGTSNVCVPISVEIPNASEDVGRRLDNEQEKIEGVSFSFDPLNSTKNDGETDFDKMNSLSDINHLIAPSYDSLPTGQMIASDAEVNSPCQLSTVLDRLAITTEKSESFSITSADVEPLDVEDLFQRYDKIVKHMVVLDEDRLARAQARSTPSSDKKCEQNARSDLLLDTGLASIQSETIRTTRQNMAADKSPNLQRIRSHSVGSIGISQTASDLTTPSQKARDLRLQLEKALQSSAAIRNTQSKLGKELSTLQWKVQDRRVQTQSSPGRSRFSAKSAPSSPQILSGKVHDRNFYHRNCCSPLTGSCSKQVEPVLRNQSATKSSHANKSPIARIRERSARRHLRDFGTLKVQSAPSLNDTAKAPVAVVDTLPHDVSIVDLVSKSNDSDEAVPQAVHVELPQFPSIVDLVSMSQDEGSANHHDMDKSSDIIMNYSDDNDDDPVQQKQIQSILSGLYQVESTLSQQPSSSSIGGTPTSGGIRRSSMKHSQQK